MKKTQPNESRTSLKIDETNSSPFRCVNCGNTTFIPALKIRTISRVYTGEAQDALMPFEVFMCTSCGTVPAECYPFTDDETED